MDPKGIYRQETVDDIKIPGNADSGKGKTYAVHTIYNDGTEIWEYRRYSGQGPENDPIVSTETLTNAEQEKRWASQQRTAQQQTDQSERKITRTGEGVDPKTGKPARVTEYESGEPRYDELKPDTKPDGQIINAGNGRIILVKPDGSKQVIEEGKPVDQKDGTIVNLGKRGVFVIRADGTSEQVIPSEAPEAEKPTMIGGKPYTLQDGKYVPVPIEGQAKPGQGPSLADLQTRYGRTVEDLQAYAAKLQDALAQGIITQAEFDARWQEAKSVANVKIQEINSLVSTQRAIYSDQSANWRQEQATANTRLNASTQAMQLGMRAAESMKGLDPAGSAGAGQLWGTLAAGRAAGQMYGGYDGGAAPAMPAALQRIMSFDMLEDGTIQIKPKAAGQPGDAAPQIMPAALRQMDQGIKSAIDADVAAAGGGGTVMDLSQSAPAQLPNSLGVGDSYGFMRDELGLPDDIIAEAMAGIG